MLRTVSLAAVAIACLAASPARADKIELTDRMVTLYGAVTNQSVEKAVTRMLELDAESSDPIWLMIDSFGGSVDAGFVLIDTVRGLKSPVYGVVTSKAYSMGAIIAVFCKKRYIYPHATMMFHEASYGALGEDPSIRSRIDFNTKYLDQIHMEIAKIIKMPLGDYRAKIRDAWWVLAQEAVDARMMDAVATEVSYRKIDSEVTEIKKTTTIKQQRSVRPDAKGPSAVDLP